VPETPTGAAAFLLVALLAFLVKSEYRWWGNLAARTLIEMAVIVIPPRERNDRRDEFIDQLLVIQDEQDHAGVLFAAGTLIGGFRIGGGAALTRTADLGQQAAGVAREVHSAVGVFGIVKMLAVSVALSMVAAVPARVAVEVNSAPIRVVLYTSSIAMMFVANRLGGALGRRAGERSMRRRL
jgi:hypothetical protein